MNKSEINGYTINTYNQYDLKDGARYSHCPLCSGGRSKGNAKAKCASLDWDRGLGTCHHCGETFQLHTYGRKKDEKPYYAYKKIENGRTKYFNDDGTESIR